HIAAEPFLDARIEDSLGKERNDDRHDDEEPEMRRRRMLLRRLPRYQFRRTGHGDEHHGDADHPSTEAVEPSTLRIARLNGMPFADEILRGFADKRRERAHVRFIVDEDEGGNRDRITAEQ